MPTNLETTEAIYQAFGAGDVPTILSKLAEDITWEHDLVENYGIPWLAPGKGIAHVSDFFGVVHKEFEIASFDVISFLEGNSQVAVGCRMKAKIRLTGEPINGLEVHPWTFERTGKGVRFRHFVDT